MNMNVKEELVKRFNITPDRFGSWQSDLYVLPIDDAEREEIKNFLDEIGRHYKEFRATNEWQGKTALDVFFANDEFWDARNKK